MRKRKEDFQRRSLSSAQATEESTSKREKESQKNVAEQQGEELMNAIGNLLHGKRIDEVIPVGMSITLDGVHQKSHGNPVIATQLFKNVVRTMSEAFFNLTLKRYIDG